MKEGQPKTVHLKDYQAPNYLIDETSLHFDISSAYTMVTAELTIRRNLEASKPNTELVLDGSEMTTRNIWIDGEVLPPNKYEITKSTLRIIDVPESFVLKTQVEIKPQENTALEGLYKSGDMYCTQCEAQGFRNITWYLDRPDVLSKYRTTIHADKEQFPVLLSNGNEVARGNNGPRHWVTWEDPHKKPAYLFALVAGDLRSIEGTFTTMSGRLVTLKIFTEEHNIDKLDFAMQSLKKAMSWDEETYGREYDLDIFMIVAVDTFNMGAMENKGLNIFNTSCILTRPDTTTDAGYSRVESVVAHEYFHNWSGNRVTCRDWFQLSLKEGFTVMRDQQFSADLGSATVCRIMDVVALRNSQFPEDAGPMAHSIRPDSYIEINNFYTPTVYEKGAEVVRMIRTLLGEERFRLGTDLYFNRHDGQAVTTEDFVRAMEDASGINFDQFRIWYRQAGTPVLSVSSKYDQKNKVFVIMVDQSCPPTPGQIQKEPNHMPFAVGLLDLKGRDMRFSLDELPVSSVHETENSYTAVLNLTKSSQRFIFHGVEEEPTPSLLRDFSAPVRLNYPYTRNQLKFLMSNDSDGFARWEAGQRLGTEVIQDVVGQIQAREKIDGQDNEISTDSRLIEALHTNISEAVARNEDGNFDKAMTAEMLSLPSEAYLAELSTVADPLAIHQAREAVRYKIATALSDSFRSVYKLNDLKGSYQPSAKAMGQRALKNIALAYMMSLYDEDVFEICLNQFESADNMTDQSAALRLIVNSGLPRAQEVKERVLADFYSRWSNEALVIDMWFTIQASCSLPDNISVVTQLLKHEAFDIGNPNRCRALVSGFTSQGVNFHSLDGSGYTFLADRVIELNSINPMVAARILGPLTRWQKFDEERQELMKSQLGKILVVEGLSSDVYEVVTKSLV